MIYHFGMFELDLRRFELRYNGEPCSLEPQVFRLLAFLVENRERLVSRDEIFEKLWDNRVVTDAALSSRIKSLRQVLGDDGKTQRFIKTIHGEGFRFVAEARVIRAPAAKTASTDRSGGEESDQHEEAADTGGRPAIAVLPFRRLGKAGPYDAIAEGLPHELIAELARLRWLLVIARGSSFRFRDPDLDLRDLGRLLQARYCLTGSVEVSAKQPAVTAELVDTRSNEVVWAERYTGDVDELHAFREDIRSRILASLEIQIPLHEATAARLTVTENLDAWSAYHLGLQHVYRFNRKDSEQAARLFKQAVQQDPGFARAHAGLSFTHFQAAFLHQTDDVAGEILRARECSQRAMNIEPLDPFVNFTMGRSYWLEGDLEHATSWLERTTSLSPNYAQGLYALAWTNSLSGAELLGRERVDLAMRLSPLDPLYYGMLGTRGFTHMARGEDAEAVEWAERAANSPGAHVLIDLIAAVAHTLNGNAKRAAEWSARVRERNPLLTGDDFFRAFPIGSEPMRARVTQALQALGY